MWVASDLHWLSGTRRAKCYAQHTRTHCAVYRHVSAGTAHAGRHQVSKAKALAADYVARIRGSGLSIYDPIEVGSKLYIPSRELELLLNQGLRGFSTRGLKLRTRSKVVNCKICDVLGYPVPRSFARTEPRFPGQNFTKYVQKANNLQIWNEELSPTRRYVLIREIDGLLSTVRVVTG